MTKPAPLWLTITINRLVNSLHALLVIWLFSCSNFSPEPWFREKFHFTVPVFSLTNFFDRGPVFLCFCTCFLSRVPVSSL